jgi:non-canonical purine NTP pyrophosphatase (RdgB/HAM1 family)
VLTKNKWKFSVAKDVFDKFGITATQADAEYPEIQADSSAEIARHSAVSAAKDLRVPVVREDHSIFINALKFPGPYVNYFERIIPVQELLKMLSLNPDRSGYFEVALAYADPQGTVEVRIFQVPIEFALEPRGSLSENWNRIIMLKGEKRTLAEYPEEERRHVWTKNYSSIAEFILRRNNE